MKNARVLTKLKPRSYAAKYLKAAMKQLKPKKKK